MNLVNGWEMGAIVRSLMVEIGSWIKWTMESRKLRQWSNDTILSMSIKRRKARELLYTKKVNVCYRLKAFVTYGKEIICIAGEKNVF